MCQFICTPNHWSMKRDAVRTKKKICESKTVSEFTLQIWSASPLTQGEASMRQYNGAEIILAGQSVLVAPLARELPSQPPISLLNHLSSSIVQCAIILCRLNRSITFMKCEYIDAPNISHHIAYCESNRLVKLLLQAGNEKKIFNSKTACSRCR